MEGTCQCGKGPDFVKPCYLQQSHSWIDGTLEKIRKNALFEPSHEERPDNGDLRFFRNSDKEYIGS